MDKEFSDKIKFIHLYVREAHADDGWRVSNSICIKQHKTLEERIKAANYMKEMLNYPILTFVDSMENDFDNKWFAWPEK